MDTPFFCRTHTVWARWNNFFPPPIPYSLDLPALFEGATFFRTYFHDSSIEICFETELHALGT